MANPQHAKKPKLNALLIGKRTVPSGCKVLNVSQQGMSLQCDPDGRLLTFSSGDAVDIFLSVQHANGHNKFTIPAIVSHVDESLIDIVFHCTDTELASLIESYRTSESHDLDATIDHRVVSKTSSQARPFAVNEALVERNDRRSSTPRGRPSFYTGLLALFITSLVLLGTYNYIYSINKRLNNLEAISRTHTEELAEVQSQVFSSRLQDGRYASLNARMKTLTDAFQSFEIRVSEALLQRTPVTDTASQATVTKEAATEPDDQLPDIARLATVEKEVAAESVEQPPDTITSKPPEPEVRYVTRVELERKPAPKITLKPKYVTAKEDSDKPSIADTSGQSTQKYPTINSRNVAPAAATPSAPMTAARTVEAPHNQMPVAVKPTIISAGNKDSDATSATTSAEPPASNPAEPADEQQPQTKPATTPINEQISISRKTTSPGSLDGPWVINLLSSPSKAYVDKMHATATTSGINTSITSAEVKGKQYWRLQITGFESLSAAKRAAEPAKNSLKIQEVWIFKRKR